jgi:hypothetical protein
MPLRVDPTTAAADWATGMNNATDKITRGIARVTTSPGTLAAAKADKWLNNVTAAKAKFQNNVGKVTLQSWQSSATAAVSRVGQGATMKQAKFASAITPVFTYMAGVLAQIDAMPDTTLDQRIAKSAAFQRQMALYVAP